MNIFCINEKYLIIALNYFPKLTSKSLSYVSHSLSCRLAPLVAFFNNKSRLSLLKYNFLAFVEFFSDKLLSQELGEGNGMAVAWKYLDYSIKLSVRKTRPGPCSLAIPRLLGPYDIHVKNSEETHRAWCRR